MKINLSFMFLLLSCLPLPAQFQGPVSVSGTAETLLRDDEARSLQVFRLTEEARGMAMKKEFGTHVMLDEQLELKKTVNSEKEEQSSKQYLRNTYGWSGGTWIADRSEPIIRESKTAEGLTRISVTVSGYAQPGVKTRVPIRAQISTRAEDDTRPTRIFREGEPVFFRFQAGAAGYLILALEDPLEDEVYFLQSSDAMPEDVDAGEYMLFPRNDRRKNLVLTLNENKDNKRQYLWFLFATHAIDPPAIDSFNDELPVMDAKAFRSWLYKLVLKDEDLQFKFIPISIIPDENNN